MPSHSARAAVVACLLAVSAIAPVVAALPKPQGVVTDLAGVLTPAARAEAESRIREVEQKSTAEIAVATVPSLDGLSVEEYATRLFNEWGSGKKATDTGVLILVAPTERAMRSVVGYGLEPILPDGLAGDVIRTDALPAFRNGDYAGGIVATVGRVASIIEANHIVTDEERARLAASAEDRPPALLTTPFFGLFIAIGALAVGVGLRARAVSPILFGGFFGGIPFLMSLVPFFNASRLILGPFALGMLVLGYVKGGKKSWMDAARGTTPRHSGSERGRSGWVMGGSPSSSSSRGSSSSSSGGSFGGGSSGGGGASGRW